MEAKNSLFELFLADSNEFEIKINLSEHFIGPIFHKPNESKNENLLSPVQFGFLTGLIIILFSDYRISNKSLNRIWFFIQSQQVREFLTTAICFLVSLVFMPIIFIIFGIFQLFKKIVGVKLCEDENFKGFLHGVDTIWACEDQVSKSIINVLAFVRSSSDIENVPENLLQSIRDRIFTKLMITNRFPKMFYRRRRSETGYYYWTDENKLTINDYVRLLKPTNELQKLPESVFKRRLSKISNDPLPAKNSALWECLVSTQPIQTGDDLKYPIIFRVHHSVGDGVALLRLFLEAIADKDELEDLSDNPFLCLSSITFQQRLLQYYINIVTFLKMPSALFRMALMKIDTNKMHPERGLTGNKKVNWLYESDLTDNSPTLLTIVKHLKQQYDGGRFSNILLAALSKSLKDFFVRKNLDVPKEMTVVLPARLYSFGEDPELKLENKFSVALQNLPINAQGTTDRIQKIKRYSEIVNSSPDYVVNYWMMSVVAGIFPDWILKVILNSKHATMVISNLPGPNFTIKINKFELENVGFFIPNLGQTACGITVLSYNNKLHFGIMADETAISSEEELGNILEGMIREIHAMAEN